MMLDEDDEPLEPELRDAASAYHRPPEPPREQMWAEIAARHAASGTPRVGARPRRFLVWAAGIAAVLAIGVAIGRLTIRAPIVPPTLPASNPIATNAPREDATAYRVATAEHLGQAEAFLTLFKASVRQGRQEQLASATARQLLATNRLLLDSPAAVDPKLKLLLQDLELVLVQIAQLEPAHRSEDVRLITNGLENGMLVRLRAAVPAGAGATSRQGAL
jgi:hypothetical protein